MWLSIYRLYSDDKALWQPTLIDIEEMLNGEGDKLDLGVMAEHKHY